MKRYSQNRQAILECLRSTKIHPTADWILEHLRPEYPNLNLATVYRNLIQLKDEGLIRSMGVIAGQEHFDGDVQPHAHVICVFCGRVMDIPLTEDILRSMDSAGRLTGFGVISSRFTGLCPSCRGSENERSSYGSQSHV
ncbi:MAG: transcriptional repressor [Clostridia bacterium]|nr:transcriptional repressor [Clostridia bacterium]